MPLNNDFFGLKEKNPPYSVLKPKDGVFRIKINLKNWEKYLMGNEYDTYFIYYQCKRGDSTWHHREIKKEWRKKITPAMEHLPIEQIKKLI